MKKKFIPIILIITGILLTLSIAGCARKGGKNNSEIELVTNFITTYFTTPSEYTESSDPAQSIKDYQKECELFKDFVTSDAFESFTADRFFRRVPDGSSTKYKIENIELSNLKISNSKESNDKYHFYDVTFHLKDKSLNNEADGTLKICLERDNEKWKISSGTNLSTAKILLLKLWNIGLKN